MNKGLESLKDLYHGGLTKDYKLQCYKDIEKELKEYEGAKNHIEALHKERIENAIKIKVLDIIKEILPINEDDFYEENGKYYFIGNEVDKGTFDLLKEVLL